MVLFDPMGSWKRRWTAAHAMPSRTWRYTLTAACPWPTSRHGLAGTRFHWLLSYLGRQVLGNTRSQNISTDHQYWIISDLFKSLKPNFFLWPLIINMTPWLPFGRERHLCWDLVEGNQASVGHHPFLLFLILVPGLEKHNQHFSAISSEIPPLKVILEIRENGAAGRLFSVL